MMNTIFVSRRSQRVSVAILLVSLSGCHEITPFAPDQVVLQTPSVSVRVGSVTQLTASIYDGALKLPSPAQSTLRWTSANPSVATVDAAGVVRGVTRGVTRVQLEVYSTSLSTSANVQVNGVVSISIDPSPTQIEIGTPLSLTAQVAADPGVVPESVQWASANPSIASVSNTGVVIGVGVGQTTITARCEGITATRTINVSQQRIASIEFPQPSYALLIGETNRLQPSIRDARGALITTRTLTWSSANSLIATVNGQGSVTGVAQGQTVISAEGDGVRSNVTVAVRPFVPVTIGIENSLGVGVNVTANNISYGSVAADGFSSFSVPQNAALSWQSQKFRYSDGSPIQDDLNGGTLALGTASTGQITNIVGGTPYILPIISSAVADTVSFQVQRSSGSRCIGYSWGSSFTGSPWGYYRLEPSMAIHVYRGSNCQGNSRLWTYDVLTGYQPRSGRLYLRVDRLP